MVNPHELTLFSSFIRSYQPSFQVICPQNTFKMTITLPWTWRYPKMAGRPSPLKNDGVKVSWDDDIPNIWKVIKAMFQTTNQMVFWNFTTKMIISWNPKKFTLPSMVRSWNDHWWNFDSDRTTTAPPRISSNPSGRSRRNEPMLWVWVVNIGGSGQVEDQH